MERLRMVKNRLLSIIVICVCFCATLFSLVGCGGESNSAEKGRSATFVPTSCEGECSALSETDVLEGTDSGDGIPYTLSDYIDMVNGGKIDKELNTQLLYKIIPEQYFVNKCEYFHKGVAYSFYIKTSKSDEYKSEVAIIPHKLNIEEGYAHASLELSVFSRKYSTKPATSTKDSVTGSAGVSSAKYYLRDVQLYCGLENVDEPHYGATDYSKADDGGDIFSDLRMTYGGLKEYGKDGAIKSLSCCGIFALFSHVPMYDDYSKLYKGNKTYSQWDAAIKDYMPADKAMVHGTNGAIIDRYNKETQKDNGKAYYERFVTVAHDNSDVLIGDKVEYNISFWGNAAKNKVFFEADYNLFVHPKSGKDKIIMSDGSSKTYAKSLSSSAQFHCRREYNMFKWR